MEFIVGVLCGGGLVLLFQKIKAKESAAGGVSRPSDSDSSDKMS